MNNRKQDVFIHTVLYICLRHVSSKEHRTDCHMAQSSTSCRRAIRKCNSFVLKRLSLIMLCLNSYVRFVSCQLSNSLITSFFDNACDY